MRAAHGAAQLRALCARVHRSSAGVLAAPRVSTRWQSGAPDLSAAEVKWYDVDINNFESAKSSLRDALQRACFVCIDCEFTGLGRDKQQGMSALLSSDERYAQLRRTLVGKSLYRFGETVIRRQGFLVVQVGLSCFEWCAQTQRYHVAVYSFYLSPRPLSITGNVKVDHDLHFGCLASALRFLSTHGFDFNKWLNHGVPFMSRSSYTAEREKIESRHPHASAGLVIDPHDLEAARGFLDVWDYLIHSGRPVVGHQCLLDLLYLWNQLEGPLPKSLAQFLRALSGKLSLAIDTKHILAAYPEDLVACLEEAAASLQRERLARNSDALAMKESRVRELLRIAQRGGMLKNLQLGELYGLCEPLVRDVLPAMRREVKAHDAGADAYMTGVVYMALHSLLHSSLTPPSSDFVLRNHAEREHRNPLPLGSPKAFVYANKLHVFASPFSINTMAPVPPLADTHQATVVVLPPAGGMVDCNRMNQVLAGLNPFADLFWIEFQRIAVITLHCKPGAEHAAIDGLTRTVAPYRWRVMTTLEWKGVPAKGSPARLAARRGARRTHSIPTPKASRRGSKKRDTRKRRREAVQRRMARIMEGYRESKGMQLRLQEAREQSAARLQALLEAQKEVRRLQDLEVQLDKSRERMKSTTNALSELEMQQADWEKTKFSWEAGHEELKREREELTRGVENYKKQAETLRVQLAEALQRTERLGQSAKDAELKAEVAELAMQEARAAAEAAKSQAKANAEASPKKETKKVAKLKQLRAAKQADQEKKSAAATSPPVWSEPAGPGPQSPQTVQLKQEKLPRVEEIRPGQWLIEKKEGTKSDPLVITLQVEQQLHRPQNLDIKDTRHVKLYVDDVVGSITLTACEHVDIICEGVVYEPGKTWSWGDGSQRSASSSGPRIFYYASDRATVNITTLTKDKWPEMKKAEQVLAKRIKNQKKEEAKVAVRRLDLLRSMCYALGLFLCLQVQQQGAIRVPNPGAGQVLNAARPAVGEVPPTARGA